MLLVEQILSYTSDLHEFEHRWGLPLALGKNKHRDITIDARRCHILLDRVVSTEPPIHLEGAGIHQEH